MLEKELEKYKDLLLHKLVLLRQSVKDMEDSVLNRSRLDSSGDLTNIPTHIADISADTFSQDLTLGLIENEEDVIRKIENALERIDNKTYGICEYCKKKISKKRLEHVPYALLCIKCKTEEEQEFPRRYGNNGRLYY